MQEMAPHSWGRTNYFINLSYLDLLAMNPSLNLQICQKQKDRKLLAPCTIFDKSKSILWATWFISGIQTFLFFKGIVQVTVPLSKFRNCSFFRSFFPGTVTFHVSFFSSFYIHLMWNQPCTSQTPLVYSKSDFTLFYCSIELFDTFLL